MHEGSSARPRRILVIANETCAGAAVVDEVSYRAGGAGAEVVVVAPALASSRLSHWLGSDTAGARAAAEARLGESVEALSAAGLSARGHLGDADPLQALDDSVRLYEPDEVVISTHPPQRSNWLERQIVSRARERYRVPVTHVVVDLEHESAQAEPDHRQASLLAEAEERVRVYHETTYEDALEIRRRGFRDTQREGASAGVVVTEVPVGARSSGDDPVLFAVDVPSEALGGRALPGADDDPKAYLLPAELINSHGPPIAVGDWSE